MNPIIPETPAEQQPAPPVPTFVVVPETAAEQTAETDRITIAAKVWALLEFEDLTRAQASIDWSKELGAQLMALVRGHQRLVERLLWAVSLGFIALWAGSRWW